MSIFQKIFFPFSNTGGVCYLYEYENTLAYKYLNEQNLLKEVESLRIREISHLVFFGFSKEDRLDYYKKKLEFQGFSCLSIPYFTIPKQDLNNLINTLQDIEILIQFVGTRNFVIYYPHSKEYEVFEYVVCAILYLDLEVDLKEILEYFLGDLNLPHENLQRLQFFYTSLKTSYSPVLKKFIFTTGHLNEKEEVLEPSIMKVGEFELNLSSLNGKSSVEVEEVNLVQKLNLNSLIDESDTYENPLELLEDVLDFAENFIEKEELDEWKEAFPDTGKKIESNRTSNDFLQSQKTTEVLHSEEQEDYTFSTLINLDAITEEYLSLEETKTEQVNESEKDSFIQEDSDSEMKPHLETATNTDEEEDLFSHNDPAFEIKLDFTSERMQTVEVEIDSESSLTSLDRQIKDALTKEVLIEEDDPRVKKQVPKKESKPVTIIITPEKKEEKISPLSKEKFDSMKEEFNAIQLD